MSTNKIQCPMIATAVRHFFHASSVFPSPGTLPVDARWSLHTNGFHDWGIQDYACNGLTFNLDTILQAHDIAIRAVAFTTLVHPPRLQTNPELSSILNLTAWPVHREAVHGLSFLPDDARFATASDDSTVRVWSFAKRQAELYWATDGMSSPSK